MDWRIILHRARGKICGHVHGRMGHGNKDRHMQMSPIKADWLPGASVTEWPYTETSINQENVDKSNSGNGLDGIFIKKSKDIPTLEKTTATLVEYFSQTENKLT